jgi:hypothetical protein
MKKSLLTLMLAVSLAGCGVDKYAPIDAKDVGLSSGNVCVKGTIVYAKKDDDSKISLILKDSLGYTLGLKRTFRFFARRDAIDMTDTLSSEISRGIRREAYFFGSANCSDFFEPSGFMVNGTLYKWENWYTK